MNPILRTKLQRSSEGGAGSRRAFTLIEIMVVICILGIVMTMGVPTIYHAIKREGLRKAVSDVEEACQAARRQAILRGATTELRFLPQERRIEVTGGDTAPRRMENRDSVPEEVAAPAPVAAGLSSQLPENVTIEMLDVNFIEYKEADEATVRFYPNGMCDEMTLILRSSENEYRMIALEITTGLTRVESDPQKFK